MTGRTSKCEFESIVSRSGSPSGSSSHLAAVFVLFAWANRVPDKNGKLALEHAADHQADAFNLEAAR